MAIISKATSDDKVDLVHRDAPMRSKVILQSSSAVSLFDTIDTYTIIYGYSINKLWYQSGWFRTIYYAELLPPKPKPPAPLPKLLISIGPVTNRISLEPKVKLKFGIGPISSR